MNPKEKAKEIIEKYGFVYIPNYTSEHEVFQCALIAVDEILKEVPTEILDTYGGETNFIINERFGYWQQVKTEIENL